MNDVVISNETIDNHKPISHDVETAMQKVSESFMELRSAVNRTYYGQPADIKAAVNRLLACVVNMAEIVE